VHTARRRRGSPEGPAAAAGPGPKPGDPRLPGGGPGRHRPPGHRQPHPRGVRRPGGRGRQGC